MKRAIAIAVALALVAGLTALARWAPERGELVAPKRDSALGISPGAGIRDLSDDELAADLDRMVELGATWVRIDLDWSVIEPDPGELTWASTDRVVVAAAARGIEVLGLLAYTPEWARPADSSDKHPPTDPADFARFAAAAVEHYRGVISTWEVWNEPNVADFWEPAADPAAYAGLLVAATTAIREADPQAVVITGGLAPASDDSGELSPETFLRRMYETLPTGLIDAVAIHPYSFPALPSDDRFDWNLFARLPGIRDLVQTAEGRPLPVWPTEFGAPYDADEPSRQADILEDGVLCANRWPWLGPLFIYALRDLRDPPQDRRFGLLAADGSARPAWQRVAEAVEVPAHTPLSSPCDASEGLTP